MTERPRVEELFHAAIDLPPAERAAFLADACAGDDALRREVESLVGASTDADGFLEAPAHRGFDELETTLIGRRFGRYRVVRRIASGGMGSVFEAEQDEPRRTVALKLLRAGALDARVLERFRVEAEVLGRLRHPGVAQVFEAGIGDVEQATPWIAMEYVPGATDLLQYVRDRAPGLDDRLRTFLEVCDAVHHGHQKGVIHRDLKPSNVLVDDEGRVKVIDFGVARVVDEERRTMLTGHGELVGTLQYMSPEQCAGDPDRVDVRTDVHALGLLLYEMLCGRRPYDIAGLPLTEAVQTVVEREPARPTRVNPDLSDDLEAVLRKALDKDPERRYPSVAGLSDDLRRYLRHEPVIARPPGPVHALMLLARRRPAVVFGVVVLAVAAAVSTGFAVSASRAKARAEADAMTRGQMLEFVLDLFERANPDVAQGDEPRVSDLFDGALERIERRLAGQQRAQMQLLAMIARIQQTFKRHVDSLPLLERAVELQEEHGLFRESEEGRLRHLRARAWQAAGDVARARTDFEVASTILRRALGPENPATLACVVDHAGLLVTSGDLEAAAALLEEVVRLDPTSDDALAVAIANLGLVHLRKRELVDAERLLRDAVARLSADGDAPTTNLTALLSNLGLAVKLQGRHAEARPLYERALETHRRLLPDDDLTLTTLELNLGALCQATDALDEAETLLASALTRAERAENVPAILDLLLQQTNVALKREHAEAAERLTRRALAIQAEHEETPPHTRGMTNFRLGTALVLLGRGDEAEAPLLEAIDHLEGRRGFEDPLRDARALLDEIQSGGAN